MPLAFVDYYRDAQAPERAGANNEDSHSDIDVSRDR
jgi:hypothetical protein